MVTEFSLTDDLTINFVTKELKPAEFATVPPEIEKVSKNNEKR